MSEGIGPATYAGTLEWLKARQQLEPEGNHLNCASQHLHQLGPLAAVPFCSSALVQLPALPLFERQGHACRSCSSPLRVTSFVLASHTPLPVRSSSSVSVFIS